MTPNDDQNLRLKVAAHIKSIADANDEFEAWRAQEVSELLQPLEIHGTSLSIKGSATDPGVSGYSPGVGNVSTSDGEKKFSFAVGVKEMRCGAYVIKKAGNNAFEIRHVMEMDASFENGEVLKLCLEAGEWRAYLNEPKRLIIPMIFFEIGITIGDNFVLWKVGR